ncbi:MAG: septal ring lytic transglycosylase RlpA family protein [Alphaproteobacteria bacterium]
MTVRRIGARVGALVAAAALVAGCSTSKLLVETARAVQESSSGSADPTLSGDSALAPAALQGGAVLEVEQGVASWYGRGAHGRRTASGEIFDRYGMTAAHNGFPFDSIVRVTNLGNGRQVTLRITDRGVLSEGRIIDVSERAAEMLGFKPAGLAQVRVELLSVPPGQSASAAPAAD